MIVLPFRTTSIDTLLAIPALVSAALLGGAHLFEALGYAPCDLCLDQREAHWTALGVAVFGLIASFVFRARLAAAAAIGALALVYALSAGLAFYHTGVEFGYWPGPASCSGGLADFGGINLTEALASGASGPSCTDAAWRFLGVSMAGYNLWISSALFLVTFGAAVASTRHARAAPIGGPSLAE